MKVVEKAVMKDGTKIQIEDWSENYSFMKKSSTVAAYPKDRNGKEFRAERDFGDALEARAAFESLSNGNSTLKDYGFTTKSAGRDIPYENKI